jgi:hypothetical protein
VNFVSHPVGEFTDWSIRFVGQVYSVSLFYKDFDYDESFVIIMSLSGPGELATEVPSESPVVPHLAERSFFLVYSNDSWRYMVHCLGMAVQQAFFGDTGVSDLMGILELRQEHSDVPSAPDLCEYTLVNFTKWSEG